MRQILNLAYPERSWIKFQISKFPDGQFYNKTTLDAIRNNLKQTQLQEA